MFSVRYRLWSEQCLEAAKAPAPYCQSRLATIKQTCKDCHTKGAKGGEVSPLTKTMAQWRTYFTKAKHSGGTEPLTKFMTAEQLIDVQTFLVNHAADSLQPETCGK